MHKSLEKSSTVFLFGYILFGVGRFAHQPILIALSIITALWSLYIIFRGYNYISRNSSSKDSNDEAQSALRRDQRRLAIRASFTILLIIISALALVWS